MVRPVSERVTIPTPSANTEAWGAQLASLLTDNFQQHGHAINVTLEDVSDNATAHSDLLTALDGYISGFVPTRDSSTELTFSAGTIITDGARYRRASSIQKILGTTWAEGSAAGGEFSGATIGNTDDYYCIAISKDSAPTTIDIGFDDNASGTNAPSGWTVLREVFRGMTDSSGNIRDMFAEELSGGGIKVLYDAMQPEFSDANPGTSRVDRTLASVPPDTECGCVVSVVDQDPSATGITYVLFTRKSQTDTTPGFDKMHVRTVDTSSANDYVTVNRISIKTNASRVMSYRCSASSSVVFVRLSVEGYELRRP